LCSRAVQRQAALVHTTHALLCCVRGRLTRPHARARVALPPCRPRRWSCRWVPRRTASAAPSTLKRR
jgi:hypothetical protein